MLKIIKIKKKKRCPYPPTGAYIKPIGADFTFESVRIKNNFKPSRLRPKGARQSTAEANILSKIKAIQNGFASTNGDIIGR